LILKSFKKNITLLNDYGIYNNNLLLAFIESAKQYQIHIHAWVENFFIGVYENIRDIPFIENHPDWLLLNDDGSIFQRREKNYVFLDPANDDVQNMLLSFYDEIVSFRIYGLHLDYIRYPLGNIEKTASSLDDQGYTKVALERFMKIHQLEEVSHQSFLESETLLEKWYLFKRQIITSFVSKIHIRYHQKVIISTAVFGDPSHALQTKMQDWQYWLDHHYIDIIIPMAYYKDINRIKDEVLKMKERLAHHIKLLVGIAPLYMGLSNEEHMNQVSTCLNLDVDGVVCFASQNYLSKHFMGSSDHSNIQTNMKSFFNCKRKEKR
jgi:uncharacterized lipoprotein YddW (UPF0748 family)